MAWVGNAKSGGCMIRMVVKLKLSGAQRAEHCTNIDTCTPQTHVRTSHTQHTHTHTHTMLVHKKLPHRHGNLGSQPQVPLHGRPPQIELPLTHAQLLRRLYEEQPPSLHLHSKQAMHLSACPGILANLHHTYSVHVLNPSPTRAVLI